MKYFENVKTFICLILLFHSSVALSYVENGSLWKDDNGHLVLVLGNISIALSQDLAGNMGVEFVQTHVDKRDENLILNFIDAMRFAEKTESRFFIQNSNSLKEFENVMMGEKAKQRGLLSTLKFLPEKRRRFRDYGDRFVVDMDNRGVEILQLLDAPATWNLAVFRYLKSFRSHESLDPISGCYGLRQLDKDFADDPSLRDACFGQGGFLERLAAGYEETFKAHRLRSPRISGLKQEIKGRIEELEGDRKNFKVGSLEHKLVEETLEQIQSERDRLYYHFDEYLYSDLPECRKEMSECIDRTDGMTFVYGAITKYLLDARTFSGFYDSDFYQSLAGISRSTANGEILRSLMATRAAGTSATFFVNSANVSDLNQYLKRMGYKKLKEVGKATLDPVDRIWLCPLDAGKWNVRSFSEALPEGSLKEILDLSFAKMTGPKEKVQVNSSEWLQLRREEEEAFLSEEVEVIYGDKEEQDEDAFQSFGNAPPFYSNLAY